ncbi:Holliday junction branch migration protein RuvA [Halothiobacillus sp. DCM-1]|uniref:Holliday junction branch migration protein RuvA n=1 Tax=Halothiobacillus sp. DCM-1 TaxID=3112558 RepID=UPI003248771D
MIGRLQGNLVSKQPTMLLVDVHGVGYEVEAPLSTIFDLPATGQPVTLLIHTIVREDAFLLFGFLREDERRLFRELLRVTGVGAKLALAILSGMSTREFVEAITRNDLAALIRLPGVGRKTAERLVLDLKDRLAEGVAAPATGLRSGAVAHGQSPVGEAIAALEVLGYKPAEATRMVRAVPDNETLEVNALIRAALKSTVKTNG